MKKKLHFEVGYSLKKQFPEKYIDAVVPGSPIIDIMNDENLPNYNIGDNVKLYKRFEDYYFTYRCQIKQSLEQDEKCFFVSNGIDYEFEIYVNNEKVLYQEGMYTPVKIDITNQVESGCELKILIFKAPKNSNHTQVDSKEEANLCCKPPVSYGWDWHPRLISCGIWNDTYIEISKVDVSIAYPIYSLNDDLNRAKIGFFIKGQYEKFIFKLFDQDDHLIFSGNQEIEIDINLWWCNGYGEAYLYSYEFEFYVHNEIDKTIKGKIGFRKIELVMNEGGYDEPRLFPMTRSIPPITIRLNNVSIFAKGSNFVSPDIFLGSVTDEHYFDLVHKAKVCHFNIFRVWGGSGIEKNKFYELCDENGIMVWQEFMLACNGYANDEHYLKVLEQEATNIILNLKQFTSLALWCGGNELYNSWSRMTEQSWVLRLLNKLCYTYDRTTPFIMTSPLMGMVHGCYTFLYNGDKEVYENMNHAKYSAYIEFGIAGLSNLETILSFAKESEVFPIRKNNITVLHHAYDAWSAGDTWCDYSTIIKYFKKVVSLEDAILKSQWIQTEGYKCIFEEARRQKPYCSMAINWCYNEPWPTMAGNSLLNYKSSEKMCYFGIQTSLKPIVASARLSQFSYCVHEEFVSQLFLLNDSQLSILSGTMIIEIQIGEENMVLDRWEFPNGVANCNIVGKAIKFNIPETTSNFFVLKLSCGEYSNSYKLLIQN